MHKNFIFFGALSLLLLVTSCQSNYQVTGISRTRILVDARYDAKPDAQAMSFIQSYQHVVDSMMSPVVGYADQYMSARRPESLLSNLLADILVWGGKYFDERPDFAVYNMGGIRAALAEGKVTYGDVLDVAPFENKICFLTLTGENVLELFGQIAKRGGEGLSHGVELTITSDGQLSSVCLHGKEIDPHAAYRVATIDYLAQGNDGMPAFKKASEMVSPQGEKNNARNIIMDYFREQMAQGKKVNSKIEGRVVVNNE